MEITAAYVRERLPEIKKEYNKYDRGRLLLIAGSYGMAGACILASRAALRAGTGYLNVAVRKEIYAILASRVPEAVFTIYEAPEELADVIGKADAVIVGPGLGTLRDEICPYVFRTGSVPLLIDADGLNALAAAPSAFSGRDVVLTPHEGEMARLLGSSSREVRMDRRGALLSAVSSYGASVLLKGPETLVADGTCISGGEARILENHTGNPCLAAAGSGDVLSGIIGALMAQGARAAEAAAMGAWIHGSAGDLAAERFGIRSARPSDVIEEIPEVLKALEGPAR